MKLNFSKMLRASKHYIKKNAASGLTVAAIAGVVVTAYFVAKETPEANKKLEENKDANVPEKIGVVVGAYPKSIISGGVTVGCILGANYINKREIATLSALCATQASKNINLEKKMREILGQEKTDEVKNEILKEEIGQHPEILEEAIRTGKGNVLCYEPLCSHFFYSSKQAIENAVTAVDNHCKKYGDDYVEANLWMAELGLPSAEILENYGFPYSSTDDSVSIYITGDTTGNGIPYLYINYTDMPIEFGY